MDYTHGKNICLTNTDIGAILSRLKLSEPGERFQATANIMKLNLAIEEGGGIEAAFASVTDGDPRDQLLSMRLLAQMHLVAKVNQETLDQEIMKY